LNGEEFLLSLVLIERDSNTDLFQDWFFGCEIENKNFSYFIQFQSVVNDPGTDQILGSSVKLYPNNLSLVIITLHGQLRRKRD
jgi:hypothetical protein